MAQHDGTPLIPLFAKEGERGGVVTNYPPHCIQYVWNKSHNNFLIKQLMQGNGVPLPCISNYCIVTLNFISQ